MPENPGSYTLRVQAVMRVMGRSWAQQAFSSKAAKQRCNARVCVRKIAKHGAPGSRRREVQRLHPAAKTHERESDPKCCSSQCNQTLPVAGMQVWYAQHRTQICADNTQCYPVAAPSPASQSSKAKALAASSHRPHQRQHTLRARAACCRA